MCLCAYNFQFVECKHIFVCPSCLFQFDPLRIHKILFISSYLLFLDRVNNWNLFPKNSTTYAVGYEGLVVNVSLHRSVLFNCKWKYDGEFDNFTIVENGSCTNDLTGQRDSVNCELVDGMISSQLKLNYPLEFGKFEIAFKCNDISYLKVPIVVACE